MPKIAILEHHCTRQVFWVLKSRVVYFLIMPLQAAIRGQSESIRELLKHNADIEAKDNDGKTPLDLAKDETCKNMLFQVGLEHKIVKKNADIG